MPASRIGYPHEQFLPNCCTECRRTATGTARSWAGCAVSACRHDKLAAGRQGPELLEPILRRRVCAASTVPCARSSRSATGTHSTAFCTCPKRAFRAGIPEVRADGSYLQVWPATAVRVRYPRLAAMATSRRYHCCRRCPCITERFGVSNRAVAEVLQTQSLLLDFLGIES